MQSKNSGGLLLCRVALVGVLGGVLTFSGCGSGSDEPAPAPKVAANDTTVIASANTLKAVEGQTFTFPSGAALAPALAGQTTTLTFTNTASATPTATFSASSVVGTNPLLPASATGTTAFGSCLFTITSSNIPGVSVTDVITVNPCQYIVSTGGVQATGNATTVQILLQLGIIPSAANQASVSINPDTGVVTVNNVSTGVSVTLVVATGATGGGG